MKYAEFAALCEREFADGGGDVVALNLTGPSAAELAGDILGSPDVTGMSGLDTAGRFIVGASISAARNPVTHSTVTISKDADRDTATVTRVVALD